MRSLQTKPAKADRDMLNYLNNECHKFDHTRSIDAQIDRLIDNQRVIARRHKPNEEVHSEYDLDKKITSLLENRKIERLKLANNSSKYTSVLSNSQPQIKSNAE